MIYTHPSHVYLRDDEYYELLSPKNIAHADLLKMARRRGLLFSGRTKPEDVRSEIATLPSDWSVVSSIYAGMAKPDPEERKTSVSLLNCDEKTDVFELVKELKKERSEKCGEVYTQEKVSDDTIRLDVTYTEKNFSKAVPYQTRLKKLSIEVTKKGGEITFLYSANERAKDIVTALQKPIEYVDNEAAKVVRITLFAVRDPVLRTKFFTELIKDIEGYKFQGADHVDVDRRFPEDSSDDEEEVEEDEAKEKAKQKAKQADQIKGIINKVALTGEQVLSSEIYQQAAKSGYYISGITWSCINVADSRYHLDLEAGFVDAAKADQFSFDVSRQWRYKPDKPEVQESVPMIASEKRKYTGMIEASALRSYHKIMQELASANSE